MNGKEVAALARCAPATVTRLLNGDSLPRIHLFLMILQVIKATEDETQKATQLWEVADADTATIEHADDLPVSYLRLRMDEREATTERTLDMVFIPGLLQTPEYAAANVEPFRPLTKGTWDAQAQAGERRDRQNLLHREPEPLVLRALIDESALRRMVGGPAVMASQLDHLLAMARRPNVTIQVIPYRTGSYGAMANPLIIMSFPFVWDGAARLAMSPRETSKLIRTLRDELNEYP